MLTRDRCWARFDVFAFGGSTAAGEDAEGMLQAVADVDALIQVEVDSGIPEERIVVGGFSQGTLRASVLALGRRANRGIFGQGPSYRSLWASRQRGSWLGSLDFLGDSGSLTKLDRCVSLLCSTRH